jgi:hypothetical protein
MRVCYSVVLGSVMELIISNTDQIFTSGMPDV